jgi:hypothetical protein
MEKEHKTNYCAICKKYITGGRSLTHAKNRTHVKLLLDKFRKIIEDNEKKYITNHLEI